MKFNLLILINLAAIASKSLTKGPNLKNFKNIVHEKCMDLGGNIQDFVKDDLCGEATKKSISYLAEARPYLCLLILNLNIQACEDQVDLTQIETEKCSNDTICPVNFVEFKNHFESIDPDLDLRVGTNYFKNQTNCNSLCSYDEPVHELCQLMWRVNHRLQINQPKNRNSSVNARLNVSAPVPAIGISGIGHDHKELKEVDLQNHNMLVHGKSKPLNPIDDAKIIPTGENMGDIGMIPEKEEASAKNHDMEAGIAKISPEQTSTKAKEQNATIIGVTMSKSITKGNSSISNNNHSYNNIKNIKANNSHSSLGEEKVTNEMKITEEQVIDQTESLPVRDETETELQNQKGLGDENSSQGFSKKDPQYDSPNKADEDEDDINNEDDGNSDDILDRPKAAKSQENQYLQEGRTQIDKSEYFNANSFFQTEDSHFSAYFFMTVSIIIIGYVIYHNKNKIVAFALEGRRSRNGRRRPLSASYRKLDSNLEEAIASNPSHASVTNVVY